jgi:hypothetical protein
MNEKDDKITHFGIVSNPNFPGIPALLAIRQGQAELLQTRALIADHTPVLGSIHFPFLQ